MTSGRSASPRSRHQRVAQPPEQRGGGHGAHRDGVERPDEGPVVGRDALQLPAVTPRSAASSRTTSRLCAPNFAIAERARSVDRPVGPDRPRPALVAVQQLRGAVGVAQRLDQDHPVPAARRPPGRGPAAAAAGSGRRRRRSFSLCTSISGAASRPRTSMLVPERCRPTRKTGRGGARLDAVPATPARLARRRSHPGDRVEVVLLHQPAEALLAAPPPVLAGLGPGRRGPAADAAASVSRVSSSPLPLPSPVTRTTCPPGRARRTGSARRAAGRAARCRRSLAYAATR